LNFLNYLASRTSQNDPISDAGGSSLLNSSNQRDWIIAGIACCALAVSLYFLIRPDQYSERPTRKGGVAQIVGLQKDVRTKSDQELIWFPGKNEQKLDLGDSIFSGENSGAEIHMRDGTVFGLGPNSMITIRYSNGMKFANLEMGTFTLKVNGLVSFMVNGQLMTLEGNGTVTLNVEKQNPIPTLTIVSGDVRVKKELLSAREASRRELKGAKIATEAPVLLNNQKEYYHDWAVEDWFGRDGENWIRFSRPRSTVKGEIFLSWAGSSPVPLTIEHRGEGADFERIYEQQSNPAHLTEFFLGDNTVRITRDRSLFSEPYLFKVDASYALPAAQPLTSVSRLRQTFTGQAVSHLLKWRPVKEATGYLVEIARDSSFEDSSVVEHKVNSYALTTNTPGSNFIRIWAYDKTRRLGEPSFAWRTLTLAPSLPAPPRAPAAVEIPVTQVVQPPSPVPEPEPVSVLSEPLAKVAEKLNRWFNKGKIQIEGSTFSMYSTEQNRSGESAPVAGMFGLRWTKWIGNIGTEVAARLKTFGLNESGGQVKSMSGELRLYRRKTMVWPQFWFVRNYQASVMLGLEVYRNDNRTQSFVDGYEMIKAGFVFNIPAGERWETGGEILMGLTTDFSRKYELSGFLNYFLDKRWAIGGGYRVHLYEAQTSGNSPAPLPYREAFGEGFGLLKYHF